MKLYKYTIRKQTVALEPPTKNPGLLRMFCSIYRMLS